jgi:putative membrane protein
MARFGLSDQTDGICGSDSTFLAWVRTGVAVAAFGFVIEKFNLFFFAMAGIKTMDVRHSATLERLLSPLGRYDGLAIFITKTSGFSFL